MRVPNSVIRETLDGLREFGARGCERCALWVGRCSSGAFEVDEVWFPVQHSTAVSYEVGEDEVLRLNRDLVSRGLVAMCQVHTHPAQAYHSDMDNTGSMLALPGSISIVVPDYGRGGANAVPRWKLYVFDGTSWNAIKAKEARRALRIV